MAFIQVPPDSTGKLVDTTLISGQHRENICVGDPTTAAALGSVLRTPNSDLPAGNPLGASGVIRNIGDSTLSLSPVTSYAPAIAGQDGLFGKVMFTDPSGRPRIAAEGDLVEQMLGELQRIASAVEALLEPYGSIPSTI
jgi:hypothetical protein